MPGKRFHMFRFYRPLTVGLVPFALIACTSAVPAAPSPQTAALGVDLGGSGPVTRPVSETRPASAKPMGAMEGMPGMSGMDMKGMSGMGGMQMAHGGQSDAHAAGTVNSVDAAQHKINITHGPIAEIGWPGMTMDFAVAPGVDLKALKPGTRVNFTLEQQQGGMYEVQSISPAGGGK